MEFLDLMPRFTRPGVLQGHEDKLREIDVANENKLSDNPAVQERETPVLDGFLTSKALHRYLAFVMDLNRCATGKKISDYKGRDVSQGLCLCLQVLDSIETLAEQAPPLPQASRFGNAAFRTFLDLLSKQSEALTLSVQGHTHAVPAVQSADRVSHVNAHTVDPASHQHHHHDHHHADHAHAHDESDPSANSAAACDPSAPTGTADPCCPAAVPSLAAAAPYLAHSFGNALRIDYGTGHELNFVCWLLCLWDSGVLLTTDEQSKGLAADDVKACLVLVVFDRYVNLVRKLQTRYMLEPAGSRGVWGLDDYHFLPFLWGAAQLIDHPRIKPKSVRIPDILEGFAHQYLYLSALAFVHQVCGRCEVLAVCLPCSGPACSLLLCWTVYAWL